MSTKKRIGKLHRYVLYENSVQDPADEVDILEAIYDDLSPHVATVFREDFCATFLLCCEWVKRHEANEALGIDLDPKPLAYGKKHHRAQLNDDEKSRLTILQKDVLKVSKPKADIISASNFSICYLKQREQLRHYLLNARRSLKRGGVFMTDLIGGLEAGEPNITRRRFKIPGYGRATYIWEQVSFNPINNEGLFYIHYEFDDGSERRKVFTYDWRLWSIAEIRELLDEVGFRRSVVYWEVDQPDGTAEFLPRKKVENETAWVAYIAASI